MIKVSVFYENNKNAKFDENYFIENHITLVRQKLKPLGMINIEVEKGIASASPEEPVRYKMLSHIYFNKLEIFQGAFGKEGANIVSDIKYYTDLKLILQISEVII